MPLIDGQVTAMALKPRKQILAQWYVNLAGGSVADYATLPSGQLYAKIAAHYGPKTEGDYTRLPVSYAYHDIYEAVSGVTTNDYGWGESFALANIYAALRGQANNKGKIAGYRELGRQILLALIVLNISGGETEFFQYNDGVDTGVLLYNDGVTSGNLEFA
jgi:hypothetical protein